jgi:hypothetical protein
LKLGAGNVERKEKFKKEKKKEGAYCFEFHGVMMDDSYLGSRRCVGSRNLT